MPLLLFPVTYSYMSVILCCYPLFRYSTLVRICWKLWVTKISPHHWRTSFLKKKLPSNHLANRPLKPSSVWKLFLSEDGIIQSFEEGTDVILILKKSCCKETVASICLLSDGLLFKTIKTRHTWDSQTPSLHWDDMVYCPPSPHINNRLAVEIKYSFWSHRRQSILLGPGVSFRSWFVFYSVQQEIP